MSDIRGFFKKGEADRKTISGPPSALTLARKEMEVGRRQSPRKRTETPAASPKKTQSASTEKRRPPTRAPRRDVFDSSDNDEEDPIPAGTRKLAKVKEVSMLDMESFTKNINSKKRTTESEPAVTQQAKKRKPVISSDEDEEMVSATDSEDEFKEKKVTKKEKKAHEQEKQKESLKKINPLDFFGGGGGGNGPAKKSSPKKKTGKVEASIDTTSPSQKENALAKSKSRKEVTSVPAILQETRSKPVSTPKPVQTEKPSVPVVPEKKKAVVSPPPKPISLSVTAPRADTANVPWVDKYRPRTFQQLVGMNGDKSPLNKLLHWLKEWPKHNLGAGLSVKKPRPPPWMAGQDGSAFKAVLLSGNPGIGKTSTAVMACEQLGFNYVEMNASDVRNKKLLEARVLQLTGSHQIDEYFGAKTKSFNEVKHVLIMDEVDGMSGNEDRAGVTELIAMIKSTRIPIICICNDRQHQKMRTLVNYCFDVRFPKPRVEQIRGRIMSIAVQEKIKMTKEEVDELIELSNQDVRQTIYNLQMRATAPDHHIEKKDISLGPFEAARALFSRHTSLQEKQEMFFSDYSLMPLFVQENYAHVCNDQRTPLENLERLARASDCISLGDIVDRTIRSGGAWKLLSEQAMLSAALPCIEMNGHLRVMIGFPQWLGKNSNANKRARLARQLAHHANLQVTADLTSVVMDYVPAWRDLLTRPLLDRANEGIPAVVSTMCEYCLIRDDVDSIAELAVWPGRKDPALAIQSKTKAALTRAINKESRLLPYALDDVSKGKKGASANTAFELELDEEGNEIEKGPEVDEEEDEEEQKATTTTAGSKKAAVTKTPSTRGSRGGARGGARGGRGRSRKE